MEKLVTYIPAKPTNRELLTGNREKDKQPRCGFEPGSAKMNE